MKGKVGIGLRRDIADEILESKVLSPDFLEIVPENWMGIGGQWNQIRKAAPITRSPAGIVAQFRPFVVTQDTA